MVDTRRLEKLMGLSDASEKASNPVADPAPPRRSLALSGHREVRKAGQARARSAQRLAVIEDNWTALARACADPNPAKDMQKFNALAREADVTSRFDVLRTQLVQTFRSRSLLSLGITAPHAGKGASFVVAGLIASLARRGDLRVVGLDLNMHAPALHRFFEIVPDSPIVDMLSGETPPEAFLHRLTDTVALGLGAVSTKEMSGNVFPFDDLAATLAEISERYAPDMIICDLPPLLEGDAAMAMSADLDSVLLVADSRSTRAEEITACERVLAGQTEFLGVILNNYRGGEQP